jgi:hypothetical protein
MTSDRVPDHGLTDPSESAPGTELEFGSAGTLRRYFEGNQGRQMHKWIHYFDIYEAHFQKFRGKSPTVLEIGVQHGGSLEMWKSYFGDGCRIIGIDIDPRCLALIEGGFEIHIGDQADPAFWKQITAEIPQFDIVIDDGGHFCNQQIVTFENLFRHVADQGVYLCEDTHTNYLRSHGGGLRKSGTFVEMAKCLVDQLHAWHSRDKETLVPDYYTENIASIHFYDSIVVFEKKEHDRPLDKIKGTPSWGAENSSTPPPRGEHGSQDETEPLDSFQQMEDELRQTRIKLENARQTIVQTQDEVQQTRNEVEGTRETIRKMNVDLETPKVLLRQLVRSLWTRLRNSVTG